MRAIGYVSLNSITPQPKGFSIAEQKSMIEKYAEQNGLDLIHLYSEVKNTNSDLQHPELEKIRQAAHNGEFDVLVIARLDRLTRNIRYLNALIEEFCNKCGIAFVSIEEKLDTLNDRGQMALNIIDIVTKWDTKRISDRTREIIAKKREKGERVGHAPFGYTYSNKKLVEVPAEKKIVRIIKGKRNSGLSYHKIARMLNEDKIGSKRGGIWYAETVKTVFQSPMHREDEAAVG